MWVLQYGRTPLHYATECGNLEVVKYFVESKTPAWSNLLSARAYVRVKMGVNWEWCNGRIIQDGSTPFITGCMGGHKAVVEYLFKVSTDVIREKRNVRWVVYVLCIAAPY